MKNLRLIGAIAALALAGPVLAQTVTLNVTPTSGVAPVTPTATWSTTPAATSCSASGAWSGSKASSGTQTLPAISANASYTLTCSFGTTGTATVTWTAPTTNTNGTPLTNLAGFRVAYGTSSGNLSQSQAVNDAAARSSTITGLAGGTWYFGVHAINSLGAESLPSNVASKVVPGSVSSFSTSSITVTQPPNVPNPPTNVLVTVEQVVWDLSRENGEWFLARHVGNLPTGRKCGKPIEVANAGAGAYYYTVSVTKKERKAFPKKVSSTERLVARCA